jgi:hypothetical protein
MGGSSQRVRATLGLLSALAVTRVATAEAQGDSKEQAGPASTSQPTDPAYSAPPKPVEPTVDPGQAAKSKRRPGPAPSDAAPSKAEPRTDLAPGEKREAQDYDGLPDETSPGENALWVPRVLLFPVYIVLETFVRLPLGAVTRAVEQNDVIGELTNVFLFGPNNNIGLVPTGFIDFGFRPSVGAYFFWNDFVVPGNDFRANVGFGGLNFWRVSGANRFPIDTPVGTERSRSFIQVEADFLTRADLSFWGTGPRSANADEGGYSVTTYGGGARARVEPWRGTFLEAWATARHTTTGAGSCPGQVSSFDDGRYVRICDTPTIRRNILDGVYPAPADYGRPFTTVKTGVEAVLDSREERPAPGSGVAFDATGELVTDVDDPQLGAWINWGATLAGFIDITGTQRVLSLTISARFQERLTSDTIVPFTELVGAAPIDNVPAHELMRGFRPGRLLGSSAAVATVEYHWPIWAFIDATLQAAVGNVFDESHLEDFDPELLRFSFVGGVRSPNHRDHSFNLLAGFGTDPFIDGGKPSSFRFLFGGTTGF